MIKKLFLILLFSVTLVIGCSRNNPLIEGLPVIDVTKNYPEKEISLNDIADVSYVHLNSKSDDFLYRGTINYATENTFVVVDASSNSILFFSKDGTPKSRFNRYGEGPQDYWGMGNPIIYDEKADEVFINTRFKIQVYSSKGEYKRSLPLPSGVMIHQMDSFDDQSLIIFDENRRFYKAQPKTPEENLAYFMYYKIDSSFFLVSKADGQVLDYIQMPASPICLSIKTSGGGLMLPAITGMVKHAEGFCLCNPETDTVFLYTKNKVLTPIMCKIHSVSTLDPKIILNNCLDFGKYQFMEVQTLSSDQMGHRGYKNYVRDKKTGEVYQPKITLPDYKGYIVVVPKPYRRLFQENGTHYELNLFELKQAYIEKKLSGKLKELVAKLDELNDHNVLMFVKFK